MSEERFEATGRRKTSVARVRLHPGNGTIYMNGRAVAEYLDMERKQIARDGTALAEFMPFKKD